MFYNFHLVRNDKNVNNSRATEAREKKLHTNLESLEFKKMMCV
jgi:hypothetical protein